MQLKAGIFKLLLLLLDIVPKREAILLHLQHSHKTLAKIVGLSEKKSRFPHLADFSFTKF